MINKSGNTFVLVILVAIMITITISLSAQLNRTGLIFSEVYLNENEPKKSWLEIFNPTTEKLILESFRYYHIKTTNILPKEIQEKGGVEISPGKCLILCANESATNLIIDKGSKLIQIDTIEHFGRGGFFSLRTKDFGEDGVDIFRYGDPETTTKLKNKLGEFVVPFSKNSKSYTRIEGMTLGMEFQPEFTQTEPSPGHYIKK